jgi:BioD-like phosphotransacetylase family protein
VIPEDKILRAVSLRHVAQMLSGSVICPEEMWLDELVEGFLVGAMSPENALRYFQQEKNFAVITGGDRPDIQLAALESSVKGIILTGGFYPHDIIVARAEAKGVPLILVDQDTFSVVKRFDSVLERPGLGEERKAEEAKQVVEQEIDFPLLYRKMGFPS